MGERSSHKNTAGSASGRTRSVLAGLAIGAAASVALTPVADAANPAGMTVDEKPRHVAPITVATGDASDVAVDAAGRAHLAWRSRGGQLQYCRIPRKGDECTLRRSFPEIGGVLPTPFVDVRPGLVVLYGMGDRMSAVYASTDDGRTFSLAASDPELDHSAAMTAGDDGRVHVIDSQGRYGQFGVPGAQRFDLFGRGNEVPGDPQALVADGSSVVVAQELDRRVRVHRGTGAGLFTRAGWDQFGSYGGEERPHLASSPAGIALATTRRMNDDDFRLRIRRARPGRDFGRSLTLNDRGAANVGFTVGIAERGRVALAYTRTRSVASRRGSPVSYTDVRYVTADPGKRLSRPKTAVSGVRMPSSGSALGGLHVDTSDDRGGWVTMTDDRNVYIAPLRAVRDRR